jgi:peroxiredoxin
MFARKYLSLTRKPLFVIGALALPLLLLTATLAPRAARSAASYPRIEPRVEPRIGIDSPLAAMQWQDAAGKSYGMADISARKATVFFFASTQCPIAAQYARRMEGIAQDYAAKNIGCFIVNANAEDSEAAWKAWTKQYGVTMPAIKDKQARLADALNAMTTPSAIIVDSNGAIVYLGRIDDNTNSQKVFKKDVREALESIITEQSIKTPRTRPFGCAIVREKPLTTTSPLATKVSYTRDIAPILNRNCVVCHRSGDVAPFALTNYKETKPWADAIASYTMRRQMPPWKAIPGHGDFVDARWLSEKELGTLATWAKTGAPEGSPKELPAPPNLPPAGEWALGKPDLVLRPAKPFSVEAEGDDVYRDFTLPADFTEDRYVSAFDFKPGNRAIVHHMIAYIDLDGSTVANNEGKDGQPGWAVSGAGSGIENDDWGDGWAPGMTPRRLPEGIAVKIPKGAKLVLQVHYHKSGKPETDQSDLAIYWAKTPTKKVFRTRPLGNPFFALKPGVANQEVRATMKLPVDIEVRAILPHMHMLGKEMHVTATLPDGTEKSLIWIKNWEFNWQMGYRYKEPLTLPAGTQVNLVATYDNTASNPNQPSHPPKKVTFGEQTTDEMCFAFIGYTRK